MTDWPLALRGVTETVVTTPGAAGHRVAAMGVHAGDPAWARTYAGSTTHANLEARGRLVVHFTRDPELIVEAALGDRTVDDPVLEAAAHVRCTATPIETGRDGETARTAWALDPESTTVHHREIPHVDRALGAIVEAAVAASRLGVPGADRDRLRDRIDWAGSVVESCGDERARAAFDRLQTLRADDPSDESNRL